MMASSQVEISSPFRSCFQNNFNNLVNANNNNNNIDYTDLWVHSPQTQTTTTTTQICNVNSNNDSSSSMGLNRDKWARAREMVFSVDQSSSVKGDASVQVEQNMGGVSSLVQKWRGFEAEAKCISSNKGTSAGFQDISNAAAKSPSPVTVTTTISSNEDDVFGDWESDKTAFSGPASYKSRDSCDATAETERLRLRVSDIIRKLTDTEVGSGCDQMSEQQQQRCFSPVAVAVVSSPRIRGRQAYNDILMQMERDRHNELQGLGARKAVSKFSHRGRIQALLRFRFLRRGVEAQENQKQYFCRERVCINDPGKHLIVNNTLATPSRENVEAQGKEIKKHQESCPRVVVEDHIHIQQDSECCTGTTSSKDGDVVVVDPTSNQLNNTNNVHQNNSTPPPPLLHPTCFDHEIISPLLSTSTTRQETSSSPEEEVMVMVINNNNNNNNNMHMAKDAEEANNYEYCGDGGECGNKEPYWVNDDEVGWEELESDYEEEGISNRSEWIDEVSRPRSDWECLRQARYEEMLDPFSHNEDIRSLLARRSVSTFLSSGLRDQIDQVMLSRSSSTQCQHQSPKTTKTVVVIPPKDYNYDEYIEDYCIERNTSDNQVMSDYSSQLTASPSTQHEYLSSTSNNYSPHHNAPNSSSSYTNNNASRPAAAIHEMELIYDMRGCMEQLREEISQLRKSIKCCMNMRNKLQRSMKKEVATALNHSDEKNKVVSASGGRCRVCCKKQVDSVLYRCGHMCTCFKCGNELQLGNGICPICRAPILDVVQTTYYS